MFNDLIYKKEKHDYKRCYLVLKNVQAKKTVEKFQKPREEVYSNITVTAKERKNKT